MVSSGQVHGDLSSITSALSQYKSLTSELSSSWQGDSFDNFIAKTEEFYSSFSSQLESQMNSFAEACDLYEQYKTAKTNYNTASSNYNSCVSKKDNSGARRYSSAMSEYQSEMNSLKAKIESALSAAGATIDASSGNTSISTSTSGLDGALSGDSTTATNTSSSSTDSTATQLLNLNLPSTSNGTASYTPVNKGGIVGTFTDSSGKTFTIFNQTQIYNNQGAWGVSWDQNDKCTRCSVASVLSGVSEDAARQALNRNAGFGSNTMVDTINQCSNGQLTAQYTGYSAEKLKELTANDGYAIVYVNPNPGRSGMQWTTQQHAMAILDYRDNNGGEIFVSTSGRMPGDEKGLWVPYNEFDNSLKSSQIIAVQQTKNNQTVTV